MAALSTYDIHSYRVVDLSLITRSSINDLVEFVWMHLFQKYDTSKSKLFNIDFIRASAIILVR